MYYIIIPIILLFAILAGMSLSLRMDKKLGD